MRKAAIKNISHPCVFTQDYDSVNDVFTESYSVSKINIGEGKNVRLSEITIQSFYVRSTVAIDTPVSIVIVKGRDDFQKVLMVNDADVTVRVDKRLGDDAIQLWTPDVNDELMSVDAMDRNPLAAHRFIYDSVPSAKYSLVSAVDLIVKKQTIETVLMGHGATYNNPSDIELEMSGSSYIYIIPYIAGLKKSSVVSSLRVNAQLEVI